MHRSQDRPAGGSSAGAACAAQRQRAQLRTAAMRWLLWAVSLSLCSWLVCGKTSRCCPCSNHTTTPSSRQKLGGPLSVQPLGASSASAGLIPRLVHQCWFPEGKPLPPQYLAWQRTWVAKHPDWDFWQWSEKSNRQLVVRHYPWLLHVYDSFPKEIMRADFVRPLYLHRYGGLYLDLDMEALRPVDELLADHTLLLAAIGNDAAHNQSINNCFMASRPQEPFWLLYVQTIQARAALGFGKDADFITGPVVLRQATLAYRQLAAAEPDAGLGPVKILNSSLIFPNSWINGALEPVCNLRAAEFAPEKCKALYPDAYAITYFAHSW